VEGDDRFVRLYESGFEPVYKAALMLSGDAQMAEDAAQEAFARALERWDRVGDKPWAVGWVMTTALNYVRRGRRSVPRLRSAREEVDSDIDESLDLWKAIRSLPRRQQEAIALHYVADLPLDQVAQAMGCENGTVKVHLWRARRELARVLGGRTDAKG
jgi:RNA polymerase sigma-70 factor (ECF subfamily)